MPNAKKKTNNETAEGFVITKQLDKVITKQINKKVVEVEAYPVTKNSAFVKASRIFIDLANKESNATESTASALFTVVKAGVQITVKNPDIKPKHFKTIFENKSQFNKVSRVVCNSKFIDAVKMGCETNGINPNEVTPIIVDAVCKSKGWTSFSKIDNDIRTKRETQLNPVGVIFEQRIDALIMELCKEYKLDFSVDNNAQTKKRIKKLTESIKQSK